MLRKIHIHTRISSDFAVTARSWRAKVAELFKLQAPAVFIVEKSFLENTTDVLAHVKLITLQVVALVLVRQSTANPVSQGSEP